VSYRKLATLCALGSAAISIVFNAVMITTPLGLGYLPVAAVVTVGTGCLAYLAIWLAWTVNSERLSRRGHRW
jgi:hypothetical protein